MTNLLYEINVRDFTCPECGEFSDEIYSMSSDIMDESLSTICCDSEFWKYDLIQLGYNVTEVIHTK